MKSWIKWGVIGAVAVPLLDALIPGGVYCGFICIFSSGYLFQMALQSQLCVADTLFYDRLSIVVGPAAAFWTRLLVTDVIIGFVIGALVAIIVNASKRKTL